MHSSFIRSLVLVAGAVAVTVIHRLGSYFPALIERYYSNGFFSGVRWLLDHTFALLPLPGMYVFWIGVAWYWVRQLRRYRLRYNWLAAIGYWMGRVAQFTSLLIITFYVLWGWNYQRVPLAKQLNLQLQAADSTALKEEFLIETAAVIEPPQR
jgi:Protein of unknown function (DUF3810)